MIKKIKNWIFEWRKKRKFKKKIKELRKRDPFINK